MPHIISNLAEEQLDKKHPVLNHGFVALFDYMGGDRRIAEAAWVSSMDEVDAEKKTDKSVRNIIRYTMQNGHTSVFEQVEMVFRCRLPIFVARQWIRHRTACLSSDTPLHFDLPGGIERRGNQLYKLTVGEVFDRFQPTENKGCTDKQRNPFHKRDRVQQMMLRCVNEETGAVCHTQIVDIWKSGIRPVYRVETASGAWAKMSADHLCWFDRGWCRLKDLVDLGNGEPAWYDAAIHVVGPGRDTGVIPQHNPIDETTESWLPVVGWEGLYEVSDQGRVKRIAADHGATVGKCKKSTVTNGHAVVSLSRDSRTSTALVHRMVLEAFIGPAPDGMEACHNDGNGLNNMLANLRWGSRQSNAHDRIRDGVTTSLRSYTDEIVKVELVGEEMTYDLEVDGPWHNFSANGLVVHNSVNEMSGRYRILPSESYVPELERMGGKGKTNKQGTEGDLSEDTKPADGRTRASLGRLQVAHRVRTGQRTRQAQSPVGSLHRVVVED